jgi:hypothetical protein
VLEVQVVARATTGRPAPRRARPAGAERGPRGRPQALRAADTSGPGRRAAYRITRTGNEDQVGHTREGRRSPTADLAEGSDAQPNV